MFPKMEGRQLTMVIAPHSKKKGGQGVAEVWMFGFGLPGPIHI
jgi:hypothetical protein